MHEVWRKMQVKGRSSFLVLAPPEEFEHVLAGDDSLVWVCYPKNSSPKYSVAISRDAGWDAVIDLGWEGVRQIAVDEDWSALRFRPRETIRSYTRKTQIGRTDS